MAPRVWANVEELLAYLSENWPFDLDDPFKAKLIPLNAKAAGDTPLHFVALWGDVRGTELLLAAGASVDELGDMGYTALGIAVSRGNVEVARLLLEHGASPRVVSEFGCTPLQTALREGSEEMKEIFRGGAI